MFVLCMFALFAKAAHEFEGEGEVNALEGGGGWSIH